MAFTRRTHIVRISDADKGQSSSNYIDVEVLDAIAFRTDQGKEVILNMDQAKAQPWIVDDTGGANSKHPASPTQRTHMKRVKNPDDDTQQLDIEVIDCVSYRDQRGEEWILDMQPGAGSDGSIFDITDATGDPSATRRGHDEVVSSTFGTDKQQLDDKTSYLTVQRNDNIAFRKVRGEQVIISCPSSDDASNSANVDFGRAPTFIVTPTGYDPSDASSPDPPSLADSGDNHNYIKFVKNPDGSTAGFLTGDAKIAMGPFWWIRKVGGVEILVCETKITSTPFSFPYLANANFAPNLPPGQLAVALPLYSPTATNTNVTIVDPISDDMLKNCLAWGLGTAVFINVGLVKKAYPVANPGDPEVSFQLISPAVKAPTGTKTKIYFVWPSGPWFTPQLPTAANYNVLSSCSGYAGELIMNTWSPVAGGQLFGFASFADAEAYARAWNAAQIAGATCTPPPGVCGYSLGQQDPTTCAVFIVSGSCCDGGDVILLSAFELDIGPDNSPPATTEQITLTIADYIGNKKFPASGGIATWTAQPINPPPKTKKYSYTQPTVGDPDQPQVTTKITLLKGKITLG